MQTAILISKYWYLPSTIERFGRGVARRAGGGKAKNQEQRGRWRKSGSGLGRRRLGVRVRISSSPSPYVQHLRSDAVADLNPEIFSYVRLKDPKTVADEERRSSK
ncbi:hypothetical protein J6590_088275 [Homalodisca vitripennis]|nr:hypothetical protein J6590_088275 [Homalodisca vitripennis]